MHNLGQLEFGVFCIEKMAERLGVSGDVVYRKFAKESDILRNYICKHYDILHTQGAAWIEEDLLAAMKRKGVSV